MAGAGTAFSFIPISVAELAGVPERQSGLASGLLNSPTQPGAAIGTAIASSVAATGAKALVHSGRGAPAALTGGFHETFWVLGAIAFVAAPAIFVLVRHGADTSGAAKATAGEAQPALVGTH